jgi:hypothetical protein
MPKQELACRSGPNGQPPESSQLGARKRQQATDHKVTAADIIEFIETVCFVSETKFVGQKLKLAHFQKDLIRKMRHKIGEALRVSA